MQENLNLVFKLLYSVKSKSYLYNYDLNLSPDEFYKLVIELVDKGLLFNIPDPIYSNGKIVYYDIINSLLTDKGKEFLENYCVEEENVMLDEVFIVHGHDNALKTEVARTLEKVGLKVTILHEKANEGLTIIQKLEKYAQKARYAIVLMTPDDRGKAKGDAKYKDRARQNVILEWGYFVGKLGTNRVCAIHTESIELPSDISGILYLTYDCAGGWKMQLLKELENVGYSINWSNL